MPFIQFPPCSRTGGRFHHDDLKKNYVSYYLSRKEKKKFFRGLESARNYLLDLDVENVLALSDQQTNLHLSFL